MIILCRFIHNRTSIWIQFLDCNSTSISLQTPRPLTNMAAAAMVQRSAAAAAMVVLICVAIQGSTHKMATLMMTVAVVVHVTITITMKATIAVTHVAVMTTLVATAMDAVAMPTSNLVGLDLLMDTALPM